MPHIATILVLKDAGFRLNLLFNISSFHPAECGPMKDVNDSYFTRKHARDYNTVMALTGHSVCVCVCVSAHACLVGSSSVCNNVRAGVSSSGNAEVPATTQYF